MTCAKITTSTLKAAKPQFSGVSDQVLGTYIDLAQVWAGSVPDSLCEAAQVAVTCHLLTLDGLGTDNESKDFASGRANVQSFSSGAVSVSRFRAASEGAGQSTSAWFSQTTCGRLFMVLMRGIVGGPRVAGGSCDRISPYAKDAWW